ncbi:MAG: hypothetical protein PHU80_08260 [Kiritimatiellae bacterium]|nr:hypothetical protein [Kiritimatiellia bacterium]
MDMKNIQQKNIHFQTATFIQFYSGIGHRLLTGLISDKKTAFKRLKQPVGRCNTHLCRDLRRLDRDIREPRYPRYPLADNVRTDSATRSSGILPLLRRFLQGVLVLVNAVTWG